MGGWHHRLSGYEFEQTQETGNSEGRGTQKDVKLGRAWNSEGRGTQKTGKPSVLQSMGSQIVRHG